MIHDMYLMQVKSPEESTDAVGLLQGRRRIQGEEAFTDAGRAKCPLLKK